jgi:hypothetical protein
VTVFADVLGILRIIRAAKDQAPACKVPPS